jgi:hypothetical protein
MPDFPQSSVSIAMKLSVGVHIWRWIGIELGVSLFRWIANACSVPRNI